MTIEIIDGKSVRTDLLTKGPVLDAGCRGFTFALEFVHRGHFVIAMDPQNEYADRGFEISGKLCYIEEALSSDGSFKSLVETKDPEASYVIPEDKTLKGNTTVYSKTVRQVMEFCGIEMWDVVKLNIEGSEYGVLKTWPGPIARQIQVSFHEHVHPRGDEEIAKIVKHLEQWYVVERHVKDGRYCAGLNYWDSLFLLRELVE